MSEDILQIAREYLKRVKSSGNENVMAICPFHRKDDGTEERDGSFSMNTSNGLWYCHSCHSRGNLYTFLRDMGLPRPEIQFRYKQALDDAESHAPAKADVYNRIEPTTEPLEESFLGMFDMCPQMLLDEGYDEAVLRSFDVGFDAVNLRITHPLRDWRGKLIGISGRTVVNATPRYKVYDKEYTHWGLPERRTEKRAVLYNSHSVFASLAFERQLAERYVVVTEGFKATMRVHQAGIRNVVGLIGSYMSTEQQWLLEDMRVPIFLMLDMNDAGRKGQLDAALRLVKIVNQVYVVNYDAPQPSALDTAAILTAIRQVEPFPVWYHRYSSTLKF